MGKSKGDTRAVADELARVRQQAEQSAAELAALHRILSALTDITDLATSLQMAARELTEVFRARGSTVTLIDESGGSAEVVAEYFTDPSLPSVLGLPVPLDVPAWKQLAEQRRAIIVDRPQDDSILGSVRDVMRERRVEQLLVAPLFWRGKLIGNMSLSHAPGRAFEPNEVRLAQTLAGPLAHAVEHARLFAAEQRARAEAEAASRQLERLSVTDALTGVPNRRSFQEVLETEWRRAHRACQTLAVLMIDIDFFKAYNDEYGHQRGDACLVKVANVLQSALNRAGDFIARYGGEEFVVILPNAGEAEAVAQARRMCDLVRSLAIPHGASRAAEVVTVSVGWASMVPAAGTLPAAIIASADGALYQAKNAGRNCVKGRAG